MMKHLFLVNPVAGKRGSTAPLLTKIQQLKSSLDLDLITTNAPGDAEQIARRAIERGDPIRIYACGGDGTLNEVVNAAAGCDHVAITNVPKGTGNDFLKLFGKDWRKEFLDLYSLSQGPQASFDLIDCNGRLGINTACIGVDARVADDVHRFKTIPLVGGMGAYILALIHNICKGITSSMEIIMGNGYHYKGDVTLVCACNGRYYGGGFMPVGEAMPDDGILDFLMVRGINLLTFARMVKKYSTGRYRECPDLIHPWHGDSITVSTPHESVAVVDGEVVRAHKFVIGLSQKKVNFFWPASLHYHHSAHKTQQEKTLTFSTSQ